MPLSQIDQTHHAATLLAAVTGKFATLNWADLITKVAPMLLTVLLISGAMVKFYGDTRSNEIIRLVGEKTKAVRDINEQRSLRIEQMIGERLQNLELRMKIYADEKRAGRFTASDFNARMIHRDAEVAAIAKKQDEVRERLIADLRTDLERLSSLVRSSSLNNSKMGNLP